MPTLINSRLSQRDLDFAPLIEPPLRFSEPVSRMSCQFFDCGTLPVTINVSCFRGASGVDEYHFMVRPWEQGSSQEQLQWVLHGYQAALESYGLSAQTAVLRRFFCSDLPSQAADLAAHPLSNPRNGENPCAVSWISQPPAPAVNVALWAYHVTDRQGALQKQLDGPTLTLQRGELAHHWTTGLACPQAGDAHDQSQAVLDEYEVILQARGLALADNVVRTWFFVRDIDDNYAGLVAARRKLFARRGLTAETHYIASTGIEGGHTDPATISTLDAYAISGVRPEQIEYLAAPEHLCPTSYYGVTFERGTAVSYRDRRHIFISGTASIDENGDILHIGDVSRQIDRTLDNVEVLLQQAGATLHDAGVFIAYIRDAKDYAVAWTKMRQRCGDVPLIVVVAPVCRPAWLFETECVAAVPDFNPALPEY